LSYKPHFGLLFPLVLVVGGQWRVFGVAAATAATMIVASWLAFGTETWQAFFDLLPLTSQLVLGGGLAGFQKLQTVFGTVRFIGGSEFAAWCLHGGVALAATIAVLAMWRRRLPYEIKAAALATASLLVTPYLYAYDLAALAVPLAFLTGLGRREGFRSHEIVAITVSSALVLIAPWVDLPTGLFAVLLTALMIGRRAFIAIAPSP
jgi:arabinofuranan 3-O-arabinosyltransferase